MSFSDQGTLDNPFDDSQSVQATGFSPIQESDFEPKSSKTQNEKPAKDLSEPPRPKPDKATESLDLKDEKEANEFYGQLKSDAPVDAPSFKLTDEASEEPTRSNEDQNESEKSERKTLNDGYRLPAVADVRAQISVAPLAGTSQQDPGGLLATDLNTNFTPRVIGPNSSYAEALGIPAAAKYKTWRAHNVYHRPTYFQDQNLELNGNQRPFQNVASAASFIGTIPRIPYLIGEHHPREKIYTYGEDRPGDPAPYRVFQPTGNRRGRVLQTIATLGLALP